MIVLLFLALSNLLAWLLNERSWGYRHILSKAPKLLFVSNRCVVVCLPCTVHACACVLHCTHTSQHMPMPAAALCVCGSSTPGSNAHSPASRHSTSFLLLPTHVLRQG